MPFSGFVLSTGAQVMFSENPTPNLWTAPSTPWSWCPRKFSVQLSLALDGGGSFWLTSIFDVQQKCHMESNWWSRLLQIECYFLFVTSEQKKIPSSLSFSAELSHLIGQVLDENRERSGEVGFTQAFFCVSFQRLLLLMNCKEHSFNLLLHLLVTMNSFPVMIMATQRVAL